MVRRFVQTLPPSSERVATSMWELVYNPLNLLLLAVLVYFVSVLVFPPLPPPRTGEPPSDYTESYNWLPSKHPECLVIKPYTKAELAHYDGRQSGGRILLAIQDVVRPKEKGGEWTRKERTVFDVTRGGQFYGPGAQRVICWIQADRSA